MTTKLAHSDVHESIGIYCYKMISGSMLKSDKTNASFVELYTSSFSHNLQQFLCDSSYMKFHLALKLGHIMASSDKLFIFSSDFITCYQLLKTRTVMMWKYTSNTPFMTF